MKDRFDRQINYMRISVTDRCNLRCVYCSPGPAFTFTPHKEILSYEEFLRLARPARGLGISKFRITGGEPLVRKGLPGFLADLIGMCGAGNVSLTTNGLLLRAHLPELKASGLRRINVSCDSLDPGVYAGITGGGDLQNVLSGIREALETGFAPLKINVVLLKGINDDPGPFAAFAAVHPVHIRFIELMDFSPARDRFVSIREIKDRLESLGRLEETEGPEGAGPAKYFRFPGMAGSLGFIAPLTEHFCASCNRLRVSADGRILPCLFSDRTVDVKKLLRAGVGDDVLTEAIRAALSGKPENREAAEHAAPGKGLREIGG